MSDPERTTTLARGGIAYMIAILLFFGGIAALLFWLGGIFTVGAVIVALVGLLFLWRAIVQMRSLRRGEW